MTKRSKILAGAAILAMVGAGVAALADDATTQPAWAAPQQSVRLKMTGPLGQLNDLTEDQKQRILQIHLAVLEKERQLHQQESSDILAVLTDDQKKELQELMTKAADEKKASEAQKRAEADQEKAEGLKEKAEGGTTTQPSDVGK